MYAVKKRILDEIEMAFQQHPVFTDKVKIFNKFPYEERIQYGVVLRGASADQIRLSGDNFMSDHYSLVKLTSQGNHQGIGIEWARENQSYVTRILTEDVSAQLGDNQRQFYTSDYIIAGPGETHYADSPLQVDITIDGVSEAPESVDGEHKRVLLNQCPGAGSVVIVRYHSRRIVNPGIYTIDFTDDTQFTVSPLYVVEKEELIETTTGTETSVNLGHSNIQNDSDELMRCYKDGTVIDVMVRGEEYTIDNATGIVTFMTPLASNYALFASYRYYPVVPVLGPYNFKIYQENHDAIPGVIISIGRRAKKGDQQIVYVSKNREAQAKIYGGHWTMSLELSVIAKDALQMEEMTDHVVSQLWGVRKNILEYEGITLNNVVPSGESEETHIETTGDLYYESSVSVNVQTEWQYFVPYDGYVRLRNIELKLNPSPVFSGPLVGYERLT